MGDVTTQLTREQRQLAELLLRQRGQDPARLPMPRRVDPDRAPLSMTQRRLWMSGQAARGTAYGNVPMAVRIRGSLDIDSLNRALSLIVARHEILRTTYPLEDGQPVQRIEPARPVSVAVEDLRSVPASDRERRFAARVKDEARRPFDPARERLFRAAAFQIDETDWGLVLVSHHLSTDGWGARLLLDELATAYRAFTDSRGPDLPALAVQYGDYAVWELEQVRSGVLESQRLHWLERLDGAPRQLSLPFDRSAESGSVETDAIDISLPRNVVEDLRKLSRLRGVTPYVVLLAGLEIVLRQCTGQDDIVVGTILSRRTRSETEPLIGNFGNNLLLRTRLDGDPTLIEVVDRTAATMRDALAHSDVPLELVAQAAPIPAFHTMFILRDGGLDERLKLSGASAEAVPAASGAATLDLIVDITDGARGIDGHLEYRTARFAAATIRQLGAAFEDVVTRLVRNPDARLSALPKTLIAPSDDATERPRSVGEEPATPTERALARLWSRMLEVEKVYRQDNFFRVGGDSLRGVYVLEQAEKELGHRFRPEELSALTLAELAAIRDERTTIDAVSAERHGPTMTMRRVDPLQFADQIKSLFAREGMHAHSEFFDQAYPDAVKEGASSWVMLDEGDCVVGHIAVFPHRFVCDGSEYTAALGANLVVDSRHRNLINAMALAERVVSDLGSDANVDLLFGDPNDDARAIMSSVGGFTDIDVLGRFVLPVTHHGLLNPAVALYLAATLGRGRREPIDMERRSARDFDTAEVERPPGETPALRPVHSAALYRRRLEGYPADGDDWYLFTRDADRVAAVLVRRLQAGGRAQLCSIWRRPEIPLVQLLRPIVADLRSLGITRLQASTLVSSPLGREFRAAGFREREGAIRFGALPCSPRGRSLLERRVGWEITDLDCDRGLDL